MWFGKKIEDIALFVASIVGGITFIAWFFYFTIIWAMEARDVNLGIQEEPTHNLFLIFWAIIVAPCVAGIAAGIVFAIDSILIFLKNTYIKLRRSDRDGSGL